MRLTLQVNAAGAVAASAAARATGMKQPQGSRAFGRSETLQMLVRVAIMRERSQASTMFPLRSCTLCIGCCIFFTLHHHANVSPGHFATHALLPSYLSVQGAGTVGATHTQATYLMATRPTYRMQ